MASFNSKLFYGRRKGVAAPIPIDSDPDDSSSSDESENEAEPTIPFEALEQDSDSSDDSEVTEESETKDPDEPDEQNGPTAAATLNGPRDNRNKKRTQIWRRKNPDEIPTINVPFTGKLYKGQPVKEPIQYFRDILDDKILSNIVESNRYALQCDINRPLDVNEKEIEQFFGIILLMCIVKISCSRMYWVHLPKRVSTIR
ncbi:uncharacterized protein LOC136087655 [Hydra vulgaris]|uniref:Uncharacterized protein LOC136087655 n=1 Tax=Hydra vulgaris TaxID=6087 RepID=A0ABM4CYZ8_HYDVU